MTVHPIRFVASVPPLDASPEDWASSLRHLENLGYSALAVADHFSGAYAHEPLTTLAAAGAVTSSIRLMTHVLGNDYRHPVQTYRAAAMVDRISNGRLDLGIGAGWLEGEYDGAGIRFDSAGVRIDRWQESIAVIKALAGSDPVHFNGVHYRIGGLVGSPRPVQPRLPIVMGGGSPRVLRLAGEHADIVSIFISLRTGAYDASGIEDLTSQRTHRKIAWVEEGALRAGRTLDDLELMVPVWALTITPSVAETNRVRTRMAERSGMTREQLDDCVGIFIGTVEEIAEQVQRDSERFGITCFHVDPGTTPRTGTLSFGPVIDALSTA